LQVQAVVLAFVLLLLLMRRELKGQPVLLACQVGEVSW
jgi:hypothetical protein